MTARTTTITYHADGFGPARPAINVKIHASGYDFRSAAVDAGMTEADADAIHELAYERVASDFWQAAEELATQRGLGAITQEGRSGGWLVFTDGPTDADHPTDTSHWIRVYATFRDWAWAQVDAAPERVARLAQDMAMDELGARAVNRPYRELTLREYRTNGAATFYGTGR